MSFGITFEGPIDGDCLMSGMEFQTVGAAKRPMAVVVLVGWS